MKFLTVCLYDFAAKKLFPSALDACKSTGIDPDDLREKHLEEFKPEKNGKHNDEIAQMRH